MSIHPTLRYTDPRAAIAFLTGALGFRELHVYTGDDGSVAHAELAFDDGAETGVVMLGGRSDPPGPFDTGKAVIYLTVADPDALHDRAVAAGANVVMGLTEQDYGSREFAVADAEDNRWCFGTYHPST